MSESVPFKIAKKLKEKGFKEECVAHYYSNDPTCLIKNTALADYVQQPFCIESIKRSWNRCELNPCSSGCYYDAPTISQVLKWLRDEKNTHIEIYTNASGYDYIISDTPKLGGTDRYWGDYTGPNDSGCWDSYEECILAGIEYVLDNLI